MQKSITERVFNRSSTALILVLVFSTFNTYANQSQESGTISFNGAVVHPTCTNAVSDTHIKLSCLNNTESTMTNIGLNNITQGKDWNVINDGRNEYSYNWINEEKQLRMLTIKYI
ncbi:hypothetical protein KYI78_14680 [Providencia rettgeri]|uniref:hypothetical protein n=1 Tax=Providencia TaxID=586 RepID=UPI000BDD7D08|nr:MULTISPECIES: hypothetical protein [Providencia]MBW3106464.1 hypothetical protein [Providencia rettgeri]PCQ38971.1 hypothetical protein CQA26_04495 [Providencia rettgeri]BBU98202.1 hypothetical protein BML2496_40850 [Providencia rettgeri]